MYFHQTLFQPEQGVDYVEKNCTVENDKRLCIYEEVKGKILKTVDSVYQAIDSREDCEDLCNNAPYRCHSYDFNDTGDFVCRLSHHSGKAFEILVYFFPSMCFLSNLLHIYLVNNRLNYLNFQLTPWHKLKNLTWLLKRPQLMNSPHVTMYVISNDKFVDSNSWSFTSQLWNWIDRV